MADDYHAASVPFEQVPAALRIGAVAASGVVLAHSCALSAVSHLLVTGMRRHEHGTTSSCIGSLSLCDSNARKVPSPDNRKVIG